MSIFNIKTSPLGKVSTLRNGKLRKEFTFGFVPETLSGMESIAELPPQTEDTIKCPTDFLSLVKVTPFKKSQSVSQEFMRPNVVKRSSCFINEVPHRHEFTGSRLKKFNSETSIKRTAL